MHSPTPPRRVLLVAAIVLLGSLTGCGPAQPDAGPTPAETLSSDGGAAPAFDGPWAAELAELYADAPNDFVRAALADGNVSDAEYAEMTERFRSCLADAGVTFNGFDPDGAFTTSLAPGGRDTNEIVDDCSGPSGHASIGVLHDVMAGDPDNIDPAIAIAACLVESGQVPASYTAEDYRADREGRFADTEALDGPLAEALDTCMTDPFDVAGDR
jgi:hypothetical protein